MLVSIKVAQSIQEVAADLRAAKSSLNMAARRLAATKVVNEATVFQPVSQSALP